MILMKIVVKYSVCTSIDGFDQIILCIFDRFGILSESRHAANGKTLIGLENVKNINQFASCLRCQVWDSLFVNNRRLTKRYQSTQIGKHGLGSVAV